MFNYDLFIEKIANAIGMLVDMLEEDVNESVIISETTLVNLGAIEGLIQLIKNTESLDSSTVDKLDLTKYNLNKEIRELEKVNKEVKERLHIKQRYLASIKNFHNCLLDSKSNNVA